MSIRRAEGGLSLDRRPRDAGEPIVRQVRRRVTGGNGGAELRPARLQLKINWTPLP